MITIHLNSRTIGKHQTIFIIAEAGVNHNGDVELARKLIHSAKQCGADCIKFQTFAAERIATSRASKAQYQLHTTDPNESQIDMLKNLELPESAYPELIDLCEQLDISFLSTPYNIEDIDLLDNLGIKAFKVASGQAVEHDFLEYIARKGKPIILSSGMCTLAEVDEAIRTIRAAGNDQIVVLQCTTNYPSAIEDCNLRAMQTMGRAFNVPVGYSDHTRSLTAAVVAVGLGASVIEKHFTLDKTLPGPDQSSSSDPAEFAMMVKQVREAEKCLGSSIKQPSAIEVQNAVGMRRSIVAKLPIKAGEKFTTENLTLKRPGTGFLGNHMQLVMGRTAAKDIEADTIICLEMIQ